MQTVDAPTRRSLIYADRFEVVGMQDAALLARTAGTFSVALEGRGVSPGGTIRLSTTLRNPDGASGAAAGWAGIP
jgi:hypothetical protein